MGIATPILKQILSSLENATIPLRLIQQPEKDALHSMMSCCSWRSGEYAGQRWSSSEEGVKVGDSFYSWEYLREHVLKGLAGDLVVEASLTFIFDRVDHPRWSTHSPYSRLTTEASIHEQITRSKSWIGAKHGKKKVRPSPHHDLPSPGGQEA